MARKKLQKFFALLLTFSMSMSLLSVGAFAAENDGGEKIQLSSVKLPDDSPAEIEVAFGTSEDDLESELPAGICTAFAGMMTRKDTSVNR